MVMQNAKAGNGSEPILYIWICTAIDTMLNFDTDLYIKCEQV